jgi:hypothetical protein
MKRLLIPLVFVGLAVGCGDVPTGTDGLTPNFEVAGSSGCYTVSGVIDQLRTPTGFGGTISGDVEGDIETVGGHVWIRGAVLSRPIQQTWEVTGGIVEPLIGRTLLLEGTFAGSYAQPPLLTVNTRTRVVHGAQKANLTYHGWTDLSAVPTSNHMEYLGVICP